MNRKDRLKTQITESYKNVLITQSANWKEAEILNFRYNLMSVLRMIITGISATGAISFIISSNKIISIFTAIFTSVSLILTLCDSHLKLPEKIAAHIHTADSLWLIREEYKSLLIDSLYLPIDEIIPIRDKLTIKVNDILCKSHTTSNKAYRRALASLKSNHHMFWDADNQ